MSDNKMRENGSREYSKDEIVKIILNEISESIYDYAEENGNIEDDERIDGSDIVDCVLSILDGKSFNLPYLDLNSPSENAEGLNGSLSYLVKNSDEKLKSLVAEDVITPVMYGFICNVQELMAEYDSGEIIFPDELAAQILGLIDKGIDGKKLELIARGNEEDKADAISQGKQYFPINSIDVSGNLENVYRDLYVPKIESFTKEEFVDEFLSAIRTGLDYWKRDRTSVNKRGQLSGDVVSFITLDAIDGVPSTDIPYLDLISVSSGERVNSELHSMRNVPAGQLRSWVNDGIIPKTKADLLIKVKELSDSYDRGEIETADDLVISILDLVDNGIEGEKLELQVVSDEGEGLTVEEHFEDSVKLYLGEPMVISGDLANVFREKYKKNKDIGNKVVAPELDINKVVRTVLRDQDVGMKDVKSIRDFFAELFRGGKGDNGR